MQQQQPLDLDQAFQQIQLAIRQCRYGRAVVMAQQALQQHPGHPGFQLLLGTALSRVGEPHEAIPHLARAMAALDASDADHAADLFVRVATVYVRALRDVARFDEALTIADQALERRPDHPAALHARAAILAAAGRATTPEADAVTRALEPHAAGSALAAMGLAELALAMPEPASGRLDGLTAHLARHAEQPGLAAGALNELIATLGRVHDRAGDPAQALACFRRAAAIVRRGFNADFYQTAAGRVIDAWTADACAAGPKGGTRCDDVVLVVGLPESGAAGVARALARHPEAGLVPAGDLLAAVEAQIATPDKRLARPIIAPPVKLRAKTLDAATEAYRAVVTRLLPGSAHLLDAGHDYLMNLGFDTIAMPGLRVLHVRRDPADAALAAFAAPDTPARPYANDMACLSTYVDTTRRLLDHWTGVMTDPRLDVTLHTIDHHALAADPRAALGEACAALSIDWHDDIAPDALAFTGLDRPGLAADYAGRISDLTAALAHQDEGRER